MPDSAGRRVTAGYGGAMLGMLLKDIGGTVKSVLPLVVVLLVLKFLFKPSGANIRDWGLGLFFAVIGLYFFLRGVELCFVPLAKDVGDTLSNARLPVLGTGVPPAVIIIVCAVIGYASTLVEPALQVLAKSAETEAAGALSAKALTNATALGVAAGMALGVAKIFYRLPSAHIVVPLLALTLLLCFLVKRDYIVGMAFDLAAATTGPVNIPINSMIALGLAGGLGLDPLAAGFGLVGLTCLCSTIAVLLVSLT